MWSYTLLGIYTANAKHITILPEQPLIFLFCLSSSLVLVDSLCIEWLPLKTFGANRIAFTSLSCLVVLSCFPFLFAFSQQRCFLLSCFLGMVVVADSPLLSTLVAQNAQQK
jgi:hypothetical protein